MEQYDAVLLPAVAVVADLGQGGAEPPEGWPELVTAEKTGAIVLSTYITSTALVLLPVHTVLSKVSVRIPRREVASGGPRSRGQSPQVNVPIADSAREVSGVAESK